MMICMIFLVLVLGPTRASATPTSLPWPLIDAICVEGPQGQKGETGDQGDPGEQGPPGPSNGCPNITSIPVTNNASSRCSGRGGQLLQCLDGTNVTEICNGQDGRNGTNGQDGQKGPPGSNASNSEGYGIAGPELTFDNDTTTWYLLGRGYQIRSPISCTIPGPAVAGSIYFHTESNITMQSLDVVIQSGVSRNAGDKFTVCILRGDLDQVGLVNQVPILNCTALQTDVVFSGASEPRYFARNASSPATNVTLAARRHIWAVGLHAHFNVSDPQAFSVSISINDQQM
jgi:hypothetical protein